MSALSDARELLAKAKALREQAESDEASLHATLVTKKDLQNQDLDALIDVLFPLDMPREDKSACKLAVSRTIETKKCSVQQLKNVVTRLHEREIAAKGEDHVESTRTPTQDDDTQGQGAVKFERVSSGSRDDAELNRVSGLIAMLIDAATILDEKARAEAEAKGGAGEEAQHKVDQSHWASGHLSEALSEKALFLGRAHDEQFKNRLQEYYDAATKKEGSSKNSDGESTSMFP